MHIHTYIIIYICIYICIYIAFVITHKHAHAHLLSLCNMNACTHTHTHIQFETYTSRIHIQTTSPYFECIHSLYLDAHMKYIHTPTYTHKQYTHNTAVDMRDASVIIYARCIGYDDGCIHDTLLHVCIYI